MPKVTVSAALAWPFDVLPGFGDDMGEEPGSAAAAVIMPGGNVLVLDTVGLPAAERAEAVHGVVAGAAGSCSIDQEALQGGMRTRLEVCNFEPFTLDATDGSEMTIR